VNAAAAPLALAGGAVLAALNAFAPASPPPARAAAGDGVFAFVHDVLPHLQRAGCASAYCHGAASGQGGFRLSLFGGDPLADYGAIVTELGGRRIDRARPEHSLLLKKARGRLDHGGGERLVRDGAAYRALAQWIADGAPWQRGEPRELTSLELRRDGDRVVATAMLGDRPADVGDRATFTTTDALVVEVASDGALRTVGSGRAFVVGRFGNATATLEVVLPFAGDAAPGNVPAAAGNAAAHALDRAWSAHLAELGLQPAPPVSAPRLARRLWLDLVGRPPSPEELSRFVARPDVEATVRALAARREFAEVWGEHLAAWLEVPPARGDDRRALTDALARGEGLARMAERVATGELPLLQRVADPRDRAELAARTLLGVRVGCARCHDHPGDRWRRAEHQAFSAAFAPPRGAATAMAPGGLYDERTGAPVAPRWLALDGSTVPPGATLARFVLDPGHGQLARHFGNRVLAALLGRGLVEPADDHRSANPPLHAGMLEALARAFTRSEGSLVELLVLVATARVYALDGVADGDPRARWLAAQPARPLSAATFARAAAAVLGRDVRGVLPDAPLPRELALHNGPFVHAVLQGGGTIVDAAFELGATPAARVDDLWRSALSRPPRADELDAFGACGADVGAFRDLAVAVLLGREFGQRR
jgi:hypothetical protein